MDADLDPRSTPVIADGAGLRGGRRPSVSLAELTPRRLFILLGLLAAVAIIGFRAESLLSERSQILQQRQAQAVTLAQFAASYSARLYDQSSAAASQVAAHVRTTKLSGPALHDYLAAKAMDTSNDDYLVVLDATGHIRATSETTDTSAVNFAGPQFAARWSAVQQEILPVLRSRLTGAIIYSLTESLRDDAGAFAGVVGVNVRPEGISPTAKRKPDQPLLSVWDQKGRFIAASFVDFDASGRAIPPPMPANLGIPGSKTDARASPLVASISVQGWPLVAVASYREDGVLEGWRRDLYETIALLALTFLGIGALVWLGVRTAEHESSAKLALQASNAIAADAVRERDLLLKEIHHRVKNSLQMTASLIYLQQRRFNDPDVREAFESTRRRLSSIGLVHEALYSGSSFELVDLSTYLGRLVKELAEGYGASAQNIEVVTEIAAIKLPTHQATPVGLIVAEVVTNAFKYAFKGKAAGTVLVRVAHTNFDEVVVEVRDDGDGYPGADELQRVGLGTKLIEALTEQLRGSHSEQNDNGAVFRLTFPVLER